MKYMVEVTRTLTWFKEVEADNEDSAVSIIANNVDGECPRFTFDYDDAQVGYLEIDVAHRID